MSSHSRRVSWRETWCVPPSRKEILVLWSLLFHKLHRTTSSWWIFAFSRSLLKENFRRRDFPLIVFEIKLFEFSWNAFQGNHSREESRAHLSELMRLTWHSAPSSWLMIVPSRFRGKANSLRLWITYNEPTLTDVVVFLSQVTLLRCIMSIGVAAHRWVRSTSCWLLSSCWKLLMCCKRFESLKGL